MHCEVSQYQVQVKDSLEQLVQVLGLSVKYLFHPKRTFVKMPNVLFDA